MLFDYRSYPRLEGLLDSLLLLYKIAWPFVVGLHFTFTLAQRCILSVRSARSYTVVAATALPL